MMGQTVLMEFKTNWRSVLVVCFLAGIVAGGMTQMFPTFSEAFSEDLHGTENVFLVLPEGETGEANLSWISVEGAAGYIVLEDRSAMISNSTILYMGVENSTTFQFDASEDMYYTVMAYHGDSLFDGSVEIVGVASTSSTPSNPFEDMLSDSAFAAFTGGRSDLDFTNVRGFLSIELFSWWWILAGLFIAYYSVTMITGDFEGKRMDLLFSTPLSRERYIIEKFLFLTCMALLMVVVGSLALVGSLSSLGLLEELPWNIAALSMFSSLPLLMLISASGVFFGVLTRSTKIGMGTNFAVVFGSFIIYTISSLASSLDGLKYASMMYYWDYNSILLDEIMPLGKLSVLLVSTIIILAGSIYLFKKNDIPA